MYAVGIDSGTQGTKVLIIDFKGKVLGRGSAPHRFIENLKQQPGASEQAPQMWLAAFRKALAQALMSSQIEPEKIVSFGVSGQQHGLVALDKNGDPIRPAKLWNDTSTIKENELIIKKLGGPQQFIKKLGLNLAVGYTASKILWLKRNEAENYKKLKTVLLPHNYLNYYLSGKIHMEYGDASGTGLMDIRKRQWSREAMAAIDPELEAKFPPLSHPSSAVGYLQKKIADQYGLKKVLVASGGGDNMMAAIGTGNVRPGICTLSLGTSGTIYSYFAHPFIDPQGEIASFCDSTGGWLPLLCTMNVTNTTEGLKALLKISNKQLEELASQAPVGADKLVFLPFLDGERVPVLPQAKAVLFGLDRKNFKPSSLARAFMEGPILNLNYGFQRMKTLGLRPTEIRATGGGAKSRLWLQIVADIFQTPVVIPEEKEGAAFGAALQSIWNFYLAQGQKTKIEELTSEMVKLSRHPIEPNPKSFPIYVQLQQRLNSLWQTLKQEFTAHQQSNIKD